MAGAAFSHQDMVDLLGRTTDKDGWLDDLLASADGQATLGAAIEIASRVSRAADHDLDCASISAAPGGTPGTSVVVLARPSSGTSGSIPSGYRFEDDRGVVLVAQTIIPVASGALTVFVPVETLRLSEMVNTEDDALIEVAADAGVVLDSLATTSLVAPPGDPSIVATTLQVISADQILGGAADWLSVLGKERGQLRQPGEDTASYRARVRNIPDAVSPRAVGQAVQAAISRVGLPPFLTEEPFNDGAEPAVKVPPGLSNFDRFYLDVDFLDDGGIELTDRRTSTAYFRVVPETQTAIVVPAPAGPFLDFMFLDDPVAGYLAADSSLDPRVMASFLAIVQDVEAKRAAGVNWDLFVAQATREDGIGHSTSNVLTSVWQVFAPPGDSWLFASGSFGHDFALAPQPLSGTVPGSFHRIRFHFVDSTSFDLPDHPDLAGESWNIDALLKIGFPFKAITSIEGFTQSDGTHPMNLVGTWFVVQLTA